MSGPAAEPAAGTCDLALVLHTHMPYVEGFGTWPFGEEWLFEAVASSYLHVLDSADGITMTVTPVLADQLEAEGVGKRLRAYLTDNRLRFCDQDAKAGSPKLAAAARARGERYRWALDRFDELGGDVLGAFAAAERQGRVALMASAATHAVLPLLATRAGRRLQIDTGLRSHRRRFGDSTGFWLPECAYEPGLEELLAEQKVAWFCVDQSRHGPPPSAPIATDAGPVAFAIDWDVVSLVWSEAGYPADPLYADYHRISDNGMRLWSIGGGPYDQEASFALARRHAAEFLDTVAARRRALTVCAFDTELLGHWWYEGPVWLAEVIRAAPEHGVRLIELPQALRSYPAKPHPLHESSWGEGKDLSTWDSPAIAEYAWSARRLELRLLHDLGARQVESAAAQRAARELLALQSSDWAFMAKRAQAGDYPLERTTAHAEALLHALDSPDATQPELRNLAPDLSLAPLLES